MMRVCVLFKKFTFKENPNSFNLVTILLRYLLQVRFFLCEFVKQLLDALFPLSNYFLIVPQYIHSEDTECQLLSLLHPENLALNNIPL